MDSKRKRDVQGFLCVLTGASLAFVIARFEQAAGSDGPRSVQLHEVCRMKNEVSQMKNAKYCQNVL